MNNRYLKVYINLYLTVLCANLAYLHWLSISASLVSYNKDQLTFGQSQPKRTCAGIYFGCSVNRKETSVNVFLFHWSVG